MTYAIKTSKEQGIDIGMEQARVLQDLREIEQIQRMLANKITWPLIENITHLDQPAYEALRTKHNR